MARKQTKPTKAVRPMTGWAILSEGQGPRSLGSALGIRSQDKYGNDELYGTHVISVYFNRRLAAQAMQHNADCWPDAVLVPVEIRAK